MPALETHDLRQRAVLWTRTGQQDRYARPILADPVEIRVRWITTRKEVLDAQGNTVAIDAQVVVSQDVAIGSMLWLGTLESLPGTGTGSLPESDVMQVINYQETPDLKNRNIRRTLSLMRYMDTLPNT